MSQQRLRRTAGLPSRYSVNVWLMLRIRWCDNMVIQISRLLKFLGQMRHMPHQGHPNAFIARPNAAGQTDHLTAICVCVLSYQYPPAGPLLPISHKTPRCHNRHLAAFTLKGHGGLPSFLLHFLPLFSASPLSVSLHFAGCPLQRPL